MSEAVHSSVYFYGVVRGDHSGPLTGVTSVDGDGPVYGIAYRDLTVIVSDAQKQRYEISRRNVLGHEAVVTALMERFAVLPARFGSVRNRDAIADELLGTYYERLRAQIERVDGMVEIGLVVRWFNIKSIIAEIVAADPWLPKARRRLAIAQASQNMRLDVGKRVEQLLAAKRSAEGANIVNALKECAAQHGVHLNECGEEAMVLDASFLVQRGEIDAFAAAVKAHDSKVDGRYQMTVGAPAAPYGFVPQLESVLQRHGRERGRRRDRARR